MKNSRRGYLFILFLSFIYIYFDGGFLPYTLFYVVLALPLISLVYVLVVYNTFKYSEVLDKREFQKGEHLDYTLKIHNVTPFYIPWFTVYMHMEGQKLIRGMKTEHLSLKPFSFQEFHFNVPILYRGKYRVGIDRIEIRDFLNLLSIRYRPVEAKEIRVFPRILSLEEMSVPPMRISENEYLSRKQNTGSAEIHDIRQYMYGDSLKKIHWKLSSKYNQWLIKETRASSEKEFWILINLGMMEGETEEILKMEDRTIEVLVSLCRIFLGSAIVLKMCFFKREQQCVTFSDMNAFPQLYELFAFMPFDQKVSFDDVTEYFMESIPERQSIMVFSPLVEENYLDCLNQMRVKGHDVSLFYCAVTDNERRKDVERALEEEMPDLGIHIVNLFRSVKVSSKDTETAANMR